MKQSTVIFGALLFSFVMYITLRGQLSGYLNLFSAKKVSAPAASSSANSNSDATGGIGSFTMPDFMNLF